MSEEKTKKSDIASVVDCCDWGQGDDDAIMELFDAFQRFRDGYYSLINYGIDDWWSAFNQSVDFDRGMADAWKELRKVDMMLLLDRMGALMTGYYIRFDRFVDALREEHKNDGNN